MPSNLQNQNLLTCASCMHEVEQAAELCPSCDSPLLAPNLSAEEAITNRPFTSQLFEPETVARPKSRTLEEMASGFVLTKRKRFWQWFQLAALSIIVTAAYSRFSSTLSPDLLSDHLSNRSSGAQGTNVISGQAFADAREPLVGKKIYLCRMELVSALQADEALKEFGAFQKIGAKKNLRVLADFNVKEVRDDVMATVESHALKTVETTIAGKYEFDELADGDYWLFSELTHNPMVRTDKPLDSSCQTKRKIRIC